MYFNGFARVRGISAPFDVPETAFFAIELEKDGLKNSSGTVEYPKEFMEKWQNYAAYACITVLYLDTVAFTNHSFTRTFW